MQVQVAHCKKFLWAKKKFLHGVPAFFSGGTKNSREFFHPPLAEMLCHPYILGDPQIKGDKIRIGCLTPPSRGPKRGRKCYVTTAFSGVPDKGGRSQKWLPHPAFSGAQKRAEMLRHPAFSGVPKQRGI